jgi:hypothetical protein
LHSECSLFFGDIKKLSKKKKSEESANNYFVTYHLCDFEYEIEPSEAQLNLPELYHHPQT